ncbi:hypothetical protein EVJ58_g7857 [Rhodofomes roseus]|uniref:Uncharacterized protein n=1 Tax=Rhodofomes roseus TaxID=34475 RepID=A0A4Y9Y128_9APHY|nr:hypothetical protein EVJ58_g7857 [Rhodofomes roseus]
MKSEIDDLIDAWVKVVKEDDDEAMATLVGQQFVRVRKTAKVVVIRPLRIAASRLTQDCYGTQHVALCEKWAEAECVELRKERLRDVVSRLREVGWGDELDLMKEDNYAPLSKLAEVNVPEKLTDTAWSNVGREIIKGMESAQTRRLARELDEKLHSRADIMESTIKSLLRRPELWPYRVGFGDIARMPEVREIMCAPDSEDIDAKFAALPTQFGDMIRRWKAHVDDQLLNKYVPDFDEYEYPRRAKSYKRLLSLDLATTRFRCERCAVEFGWDCDLYYPSVLSHDCLHGETEWMDDETDTVYAHFVEEYVGSEGFYTYRLHAVPLTTQARKLFELCGKDTDTVTAQEMDALGVRFVRDEEYIMTWRAATSSSQDPDGTWRMATSGEASKAQKHERRIQLEEARWFCRTCDEPQHARGWYCRDALRHLATMHGGVTLSLECEHLQALPGYDKSQDDFQFKLDSLDSDEKAKRVYQL